MMVIVIIIFLYDAWLLLITTPCHYYYYYSYSLCAWKLGFRVQCGCGVKPEAVKLNLGGPSMNASDKDLPVAGFRVWGLGFWEP